MKKCIWECGSRGQERGIGEKKKMSWKVMLKVLYAAEPVSLGTWVFEPKGKQRRGWNTDQGYFPRKRPGGAVALAMNCHGWHWYLLPMLHTWKLKGVLYEQDQQVRRSSGTKGQFILLQIWWGLLETDCQPYDWYRNQIKRVWKYI